MCIYGQNKSLFALSGGFIEQICRLYLKYTGIQYIIVFKAVCYIYSFTFR